MKSSLYADDCDFWQHTIFGIDFSVKLPYVVVSGYLEILGKKDFLYHIVPMCSHFFLFPQHAVQFSLRGILWHLIFPGKLPVR